jgi:hypothetical protein
MLASALSSYSKYTGKNIKKTRSLISMSIKAAGRARVAIAACVFSVMVNEAGCNSPIVQSFELTGVFGVRHNLRKIQYSLEKMNGLSKERDYLIQLLDNVSENKCQKNGSYNDRFIRATRKAVSAAPIESVAVDANLQMSSMMSAINNLWLIQKNMTTGEVIELVNACKPFVNANGALDQVEAPQGALENIHFQMLQMMDNISNLWLTKKTMTTDGMIALVNAFRPLIDAKGAIDQVKAPQEGDALTKLALEGENKQLRAKVIQLENQEQSHMAALAASQQKRTETLAELSKQLESQRDELDEVRGREKRLTKLLQSQEEDNQKKLSHLEEQNTKLNDRLREQTEMNTSKQKELLQLKDKSKKELANMERKAEEDKLAYDKKSSDLDLQLRQALDSQKTEHDGKMQEQQELLKVNEIGHDTSIGKLKEAHQKEYEKLNAALKESQEQIRQLLEDSARKDQMHKKELSQQLRSQKTELERGEGLLAENMNLRSQMGERQLEHDEQLSQLNQDNQQLREKVITNESLIKVQRQQLEDMEKNKKLIELGLELESQKVAHEKEKVQALREAKEKGDITLGDNHNQLEALKDKYSSLETSQQELKEKYRDLQLTAADEKKQSDELRSQIENLKDSLKNQATHASEEQQKMFTVKQEELTRCQRDLADANSEKIAALNTLRRFRPDAK